MLQESPLSTSYTGDTMTLNEVGLTVSKSQLKEELDSPQTNTDIWIALLDKAMDECLFSGKNWVKVIPISGKPGIAEGEDGRISWLPGK